ncbi:IS3 family transposase [Niveispirillum lacus]|uniref:IS3 family transposase n=1 Tax=Niveispirillum lacus TaxID=1981099 RepID=A0A255YYT8_9PROT|nr:IS3 family transposase [Niveispirillum lacus]OYQ34362.1 IS3 family transposase [Niveispirillum lacus]
MVRVKQDKIMAAFKQDALRILSTSGRTVAEVAADLGIGKSTLQRWKSDAAETELLSGPHPDVEKELAWLRLENKILRQERDLLKNAGGLLRQGDKSMIYRLIDAKKATIPVRCSYRLLGVSSSGYYAWKQRKLSLQKYVDMILLAHVNQYFTLSHETYGSPRMHAELKAAGLSCGRHRIARLMRDNGLKALMKRRYKKTTDSGHGGPVAPNLLDQDFSTEGSNQKWGVDISYIWTAESWLHLAVAIDLYSRRVVGWAVSDRMKKDLAITNLQRAIATRRPKPSFVHHSDRGNQYCSDEYQKILKAHGMEISMSGKGNCYDNAMVETFFKTLKSELIWRTIFLSRLQAERAIGTFIDGFYNPTRRHSALGYKSPILFEAAA